MRDLISPMQGYGRKNCRTITDTDCCLHVMCDIYRGN